MDEPVLPARIREWRDAEPIRLSAKGQDLQIFPAGADRRRALLELIDAAERSLRVCFYIFAEDEISVAVRDALIRAARRGVAVTLLIDGFGASADEAFFAPLIAAGARFCEFSARPTLRYLIRNHQKMVIADETRVMFGGFNIENDYFAPPQENGWNDLGLILAGPAAGRLVDWFDRLAHWTADPKRQWRSIRKLVREWDGGDAPVEWLIGGPSRHLSGWAKRITDDLKHGRRLDLIMAYFSPSPKLMRRIAGVAKSGTARLITAGKSDNGATIGAARALYGWLLRRDCEIHEFHACKMHTKLMVLDDAVYVGSANFDVRSLYINLELMLRIEDAALAERMRELIAQHLPGAIAITPELYRKHATVLARIRWTLSWFLVTVVDYTVSRRLNLGL